MKGISRMLKTQLGSFIGAVPGRGLGLSKAHTAVEKGYPLVTIYFP